MRDTNCSIEILSFDSRISGHHALKISVSSIPRISTISFIMRASKKNKKDFKNFLVVLILVLSLVERVLTFGFVPFCGWCIANPVELFDNFGSLYTNHPQCLVYNLPLYF